MLATLARMAGCKTDFLCTLLSQSLLHVDRPLASLAAPHAVDLSA